MGSRDAYNRRDRRWQPSQRQREVLDLLVEGATNAEIAVRLGITVDGAKWHVGELLAQTGCEDRQALASWWRRERARAGHGGVFALVHAGWLARGALVVAVGAMVLAAAMLTGGRDDAPSASAGATPTPRPGPTPWPEEALEALAASQGPPPDTCEPPEAQDLRLVDASELLAEGLVPAGRVVISAHCPLYVANRVDRAVVWVGGGGLLHFEPENGRGLVRAQYCCASALFTEGGADYQFSASGWPGESGWMEDAFSPVDERLGRIGVARPDGAYLMIHLREWTWGNGLGLQHRVAFSSDGQMFIDPTPVSGDSVVNDLTGEMIDVRDLGTGSPLAVDVIKGVPLAVDVGTGYVRTDCWDESVCKVYLDGVRGAREGDTGLFNPPVMLTPFDGVLSCVRSDVEAWNIDGPVLAYELSNGPFTLRIAAFGGAWEAWEDCRPRLAQRGTALEVWRFTYIEAFIGGEPASVVATRDGRLYFGPVELVLDCPCEMRQ